MRSPFHAGEQAVQARLGVREAIEPWAQKVVRGELPAEHRAFYATLPWLVVAARDPRGRPWVTALAGTEGFVDTPDARTLRVAAHPALGDPLRAALAPGADVGVLGIEPASRRRNRVNGRVTRTAAGGFELGVDQGFGNCPQYISPREWRPVPEGVHPQPARSHRALSAAHVQAISAADTFFIGTGHRGAGEDPAFGMDASHRGGEPGFVRVESPTRLVVPDYAGNHHYNTIGNLELDPRAGLLFVDFEAGDLLHLTARVSIDWDSPELDEHPGAQRLLSFDLDEIVERPGALPLRASAPREGVRSLRVVGKVRESADVTSFVFAAHDGAPLPPFEPGQHLPIELSDAGGPVRRTYSLSSAPADEVYRISVKREAHGRASRLLHDHTRVGDLVSTGQPAGSFTLPKSGRPLVLVGAGVGVTPLVAMLRHLVSTRDPRPVAIVTGSRDGDHAPLSTEIRALATDLPNVRAHRVFSRPRPEDDPRRDFDSVGRIDGALATSFAGPLLEADAEFFLCGPAGFLAGLAEDLERHGVASERIHWESFGPLS